MFPRADRDGFPAKTQQDHIARFVTNRFEILFGKFYAVEKSGNRTIQPIKIFRLDVALVPMPDETRSRGAAKRGRIHRAAELNSVVIRGIVPERSAVAIVHRARFGYDKRLIGTGELSRSAFQ